MAARTRTEGALVGLLKRANRIAGSVVYVRDGVAELWLNERSGDRQVVERGLGAIEVDVRSLIEDGVGDPDPIKVPERVYWTVCNNYGTGDAHPSFDEAVAAARATITRTPYPGITPREGDLVEGGIVVAYSRAAVALRQKCRYAPYDAPTLGTDEELLRWEVYLDRVALVPRGQGGLTREQEADVRGLDVKSEEVV